MYYCRNDGWLGVPAIEDKCDRCEAPATKILPFDLIITYSGLGPGQFAISLPNGQHYLFVVLETGVGLIGKGAPGPGATHVELNKAVMLARPDVVYKPTNVRTTVMGNPALGEICEFCKVGTVIDLQDDDGEVIGVCCTQCDWEVEDGSKAAGG